MDRPLNQWLTDACVMRKCGFTFSNSFLIDLGLVGSPALIKKECNRWAKSAWGVSLFWTSIHSNLIKIVMNDLYQLVLILVHKGIH
jgi:hypothetical protein